MALTESRIRQIINEETKRALSESDHFSGPHFRPGSVKRPSLGRYASFEPPEGEWEPDPFDDFGGGEEVGDPIDSDDTDDRPDDDDSELDELDEAKKKHKASAGTLAAFKKGAKKKGGERKKRRAGFDAAMKSAEKWADDPAAVAQAATIKATGKPVVAKGEKRKLKKESIADLRDQLMQIILES